LLSFLVEAVQRFIAFVDRHRAGTIVMVSVLILAGSLSGLAAFRPALVAPAIEGGQDLLLKLFSKPASFFTWLTAPRASSLEATEGRLQDFRLLELEEEAPGFVCEVIDSFFLTAEENLLRMNAAIERGDLDDLRSAAHMVRGSGQQLGARRVGATCTKLENIGAVEEATPIIRALRKDLEGAREALTGLANRALDAAS
jgi:HPt (histidine-containing phosphotransfer) domain-containing protein